MSLSCITNYLPSLRAMSVNTIRGTFRLGARTVGCYIGSELAGNACLLHAPTLLNQLGYNIGASSTIADFVPSWFQDTAPTGTIPWLTGQATLSITYPRIDSASRALGGAVGTMIGGYLADGTLFVFDLALEGLGYSEITNENPLPPQRNVSQAAPSRSKTRFQIVNGRFVPLSS